MSADTTSSNEPHSADAAPTWTRTTFVIGAPGRLDRDGDRRHPRLYAGAESAVAAYADVEVVQDPTWLRHEIEHYARRAVDCAGLTLPWCGRTLQRRGRARVIVLMAGAHAELVWLSGRDTAVRLSWQRVVQTPTGTMRLDDPPAEFTAALLMDHPSRLEAFEFDAAHEAAWTAAEVDRRLYYVEQVVAGLPGVSGAIQRERAMRFVADALAELGRLRATLDPSGEPPAAGDAGFDAIPLQLGDQLAAVRAWWARRALPPWCAAELTSSSALVP